MAGKPKSMSQIKQLLRMYDLGHSKKGIARDLNMSKNTVKSYIEKVELSKFDIKELLKLDDPVLESKFHPGNPAYKDNRYELLKSKFPHYRKELNRVGVTQQLLWEEYIQENPNGYSRSQFCHHLSQYLSTVNPSMVLKHEPGDKLYVDFAGKKIAFHESDADGTVSVIECQVFVACLPYSNYCFAMAVRSQSVHDFLHALSCCLKELGGCPKALVPDNLKAAVIQANRYEPKLNQAMEDFANHYGFTVVPTRVRKPKDKALVENEVKLIYTRVYAKLRNQTFSSLQDLNEAIKVKIRDHNQTRMQQKPYCREECFLSDEKHLLNPLPAEVFEIKYYANLKVAKNNHVFLGKDKHYYSVPYTYIGRNVKMIYTRTLVSIYCDGKKIATHIRGYSTGRYTTKKDHLCSQHDHYLDRSPEYYIMKASKISNGLHELVQLIFTQNRYPEQLYKTCDGLLNIGRKTDPETLDKACKTAMDVERYSYQFITNIIRSGELNNETEKIKPIPKHENVRGSRYYNNK
jgi:transposase